ncbi:MAG: iron-containing alcohol dehydrogenase, partial [Pirellulaceae bacterium]|nr:iron-containing alcohol dehydrogenase [Pirellulaceae bacterium]
MADELLQVEVRLPHQAYTIQIGTDILDQVAETFSRQAGARHAVIVTDRNVRPLHADSVTRSLEEAGIQSHLLVIEPGESSKSIDVAGQLWADVLATGADRTSMVVAVGGGV